MRRWSRKPCRRGVPCRKYAMHAPLTTPPEVHPAAMQPGPPMVIPASSSPPGTAGTAPAATVPVTKPHRPRRRPRRPRRPRFPRRPCRRRLPRGLWLWVWATAGTPATAMIIRGAMLGSVSTQCKSAGRPARRPPTARASPTPRPPQTQIILMGASQPAAAAACFTRGRPLPHSRPGTWAT